MNLYEPYDPGPSAAPPAAPRPPAAPASPYTTPAPNPWVRGQLQAQAKRAYDAAKLRLGAKRGDLLRRYGYEESFDAAGNSTGMKVSANSPYGLIQQMYRNQAGQSEQVERQAQSRGFAGTHGLAGQAGEQLRYAQGAESTQLGTDLQGGLTGISDELRGAGVDYENALSNADIEATRAAIDDQQFNPAAASGESEVEGGPGAPGVQKTPTGNRVLWGGNYVTKNRLIQILKSKGVRPTAWASNHPAAARALGMK